MTFIVDVLHRINNVLLFFVLDCRFFVLICIPLNVFLDNSVKAVGHEHVPYFRDVTTTIAKHVVTFTTSVGVNHIEVFYTKIAKFVGELLRRSIGTPKRAGTIRVQTVYDKPLLVLV